MYFGRGLVTFNVSCAVFLLSLLLVQEEFPFGLFGLVLFYLVCKHEIQEGTLRAKISWPMDPRACRTLGPAVLAPGVSTWDRRAHLWAVPLPVALQDQPAEPASAAGATGGAAGAENATRPVTFSAIRSARPLCWSSWVGGEQGSQGHQGCRVVCVPPPPATCVSACCCVTSRRRHSLNFGTLLGVQSSIIGFGPVATMCLSG